MPYKITVASGKGGTGKTTISVNLLHFLSASTNKNVELADCDVEEPNALIFLGDSENVQEQIAYQSIPEINNELCTYCKRCVDYCEFNAITMIPSMNFAEVNSSLCHSCGACLAACEDGAITENDFEIGLITHYKVSNKSHLSEGRLKVGSAMQTMLIKQLKASTRDNTDIIIYDAPPGTSCSVVESISDANFVIIVTEPTPFGLHDTKLMVELLRDTKLPFGVIINKAGMGNKDLYTYLKKEEIDIVGEVPFAREYASSYASGNLFKNIPSEIEESMKNISAYINHKVLDYERDNYLKR